MDDFVYRRGELFCEGVPVHRIAEEVGTPVYIYSKATLTSHYQNFQRAFGKANPLICYSVKGCSNIHICRLLHDLGSGFDVVSGGELYRVLTAGGNAGQVVYAGVGKTDREIRQAIEAGIGYFNIESEQELEQIESIAAEMGKTVRATLRVNPDVDPKTHRYTSTGKKESKFGVDLERAKAVFDRHGHEKHVELSGVHVHIGSPVNQVEPYIRAIEKVLTFIEKLRSQGFEITMLDIGGGFGADYLTGQSPEPKSYAEAILPLLEGKGLKLVLEPGRSISGNAGIFLTRVLSTKENDLKRFVIVDGGMNDLIRPMLYEAFHFIWPARVDEKWLPTGRSKEAQQKGVIPVDVVGPICESGDYLGLDRTLPPVKKGDLLSVFTAGAYSFSMSSQYNSRPRAAEVLVEGDGYRVIRARESYEDLIRGETI